MCNNAEAPRNDPERFAVRGPGEGDSMYRHPLRCTVTLSGGGLYIHSPEYIVGQGGPCTDISVGYPPRIVS